MTAEEYEELIGRHEHVEHQALRQEVAKEFAQLMAGRENTTIESNKYLSPKQPPPLPIEANRCSASQFRRSAPWPRYSTIQRMSHMLFHSILPPEKVTKYFEAIKAEKIQIDIALQVFALMDESVFYWKKMHFVGDKYAQRYSDETRKYALSKATWPLQIALTITDFHLDHIVDIVYLKDKWHKDFEEKERERRKERRERREKNAASETCKFEFDQHRDSNEETFESLCASTNTTVYDDETDSEFDIDSEEQVIGKIVIKQEKEEMKQAKQQIDCSIDDLFGNLFDGKDVAFAKDFEIDLKDDKEEEEESHLMLDRLYGKYPDLDRNLIKQTYAQENEDYDTTVFQLDVIDQDTKDFINSQD